MPYWVWDATPRLAAVDVDVLHGFVGPDMLPRTPPHTAIK